MCRYKPHYKWVKPSHNTKNEVKTLKQLQDTSTKPYYRCLSCPKFRTLCGGIPTRGLDLKEWSEYIRYVMDHFGLSAAYVADKSEVSLRKVESVHAINVEQDIMRANARRIEQVVLGPASQFMCDADSMSATEKIASLEAEVAYWRKENDRKAKIIDKYLD